MFHNFGQSADARGNHWFAMRIGERNNPALGRFNVGQRDDGCLLEQCRTLLVGDVLVVDNEAIGVDHHFAITIQAFPLSGYDYLCVRDSRRYEGFRANQVLEALVRPNASEEQHGRRAGVPFVGCVFVLSELNVGNHVHAGFRQSILSKHKALDLLRVDDDVIGAADANIQYPLRRHFRRLVSGVNPNIMDGQHEAASGKKSQREVEPELALLQVNDIRTKVPHFPADGFGRSGLSHWLPQPRRTKRPKVKPGAIEMAVGFHFLLRKQEHDLSAARQRCCEPNAVLAEVVRD
jgi:hypothetical protein